MTGAIEFMKAWREVCKRQWRCDGCPIEELCEDYGHEISDNHIAELVRTVMAEARKPKTEEHKTPKTQDEAHRAYSGEEFWGEDLIGHEREDWG